LSTVFRALVFGWHGVCIDGTRRIADYAWAFVGMRCQTWSDMGEQMKERALLERQAASNERWDPDLFFNETQKGENV